MAFKINIAHKGKTYKTETTDEWLVGHAIGETIQGKELGLDFEGYELEITGTADKAGFAGFGELEGPGLKKILLGYGKGMNKKPKKGKKAATKPKGLKLRKTVRGREISLDTVQINTKVIKEGTKKFDSFFEAPAEEVKKE